MILGKKYWFDTDDDHQCQMSKRLIPNFVLLIGLFKMNILWKWHITLSDIKTNKTPSHCWQASVTIYSNVFQWSFLSCGCNATGCIREACRDYALLVFGVLQTSRLYLFITLVVLWSEKFGVETVWDIV